MFNKTKQTREFQRSLDTEEFKKRRQNNNLSLRRKDRQKILEAKRMKFAADKQRARQQPSSQSPQRQQQQNNGNTLSSSQSPQNIANQQYIRESLQMLPKWVKGCFQNHPGVHYECVQNIRKLLSIERKPPIQQVIESGIVPRLIQFLKMNDFHALQFEAAWTLTNIASGTAENTAKVINSGAIPVFIDLIKSPQLKVKEQVIWALGNIAGDSPECRNLVLNNNIMPNLIVICRTCNNYLIQHQQYMQQVQQQKQMGMNPNANNGQEPPSDPLSFLKNVSWVLSNFCRGKPTPKMEHVAQIVECLWYLKNVPDTEIQTNFSWAFSYLTTDIDNDNDTLLISKMNQNGITQHLIQLLGHPENAAVRRSAMRAVGNIVTGSDEFTQKCLEFGLVPRLKKLLEYSCHDVVNSRKDSLSPLKREICWTISNITAGTVDQINYVVSSEIFPVLVRILLRDRYEVAKEALWAISNATSGGTDDQIKYLVNHGVIEAISKFIPKVKNHGKLTLVLLECLENILTSGETEKSSYGTNKYADGIEECGGLTHLEALYQDERISDSIAEKAQDLLTRYWECEQEQVENNFTENFNNNNQQNNQNNQNNPQNNNQQQQNNNNNSQPLDYGIPAVNDMMNNQSSNSGSTFGFGIANNNQNNANNNTQNTQNNQNNQNNRSYNF